MENSADCSVFELFIKQNLLTQQSEYCNPPPMQCGLINPYRTEHVFHNLNAGGSTEICRTSLTFCTPCKHGSFSNMDYYF